MHKKSKGRSGSTSEKHASKPEHGPRTQRQAGLSNLRGVFEDSSFALLETTIQLRRPSIPSPYRKNGRRSSYSAHAQVHPQPPARP